MRWTAVILICACGATPREISGDVKRGAGGEGAAAVLAQLLFADRLHEPTLRASLLLARRAVAEVDDDAASYLLLARGAAFLSDAFLEGKDERVAVFEQGAAFAERGLRARFPAFESRRAAGADVDQAALGLGPEAAPLLYWHALDLIRWADAKGWATSMRTYKMVFREIELVQKWDEQYDDAGPARFFGAARAEAPAIAGGSLDESRTFFARAVELAPNCLRTRVELARYLARKAGDRALYESSLRYVEETPSESLPDSIPEQEIAKRKARALGPW
jgi:hypothetical protein